MGFREAFQRTYKGVSKETCKPHRQENRAHKGVEAGCGETAVDGVTRVGRSSEMGSVGEITQGRVCVGR